MRNFNRFIMTILVLFVNAMTALPESEQGNRGPLYLTSAWNLVKGDLSFHANSRFYFNNKTFSYSNSPTTAVTFWDIQGGLNLYYGLGKHFQIGLTQILYQDNHKGGKGYNFPDDLFLKMKFGSLLGQAGLFDLGVNVLTRIPVAQYHNLQLEPYSAGRLEFGIIGLLSYSRDQINHEDGFNAHANLGIIDHNDNGIKLNVSSYPEYVNTKNSREIYGGLAVIVPTTRFDFSFELYGNYNINKPPPTAYSRHNYLYISPGVTYKPFYWLSLCFGFDFRMTPNHPAGSGLVQNTMSNVLPTYPTWRVNFSLKMNLTSKIKGRFETKEPINSSVVETEKNGKKDVIKDIAEERKQIENAEAELEKIRSEREKMDDILKRLRKALEIKETTEKKKDKENH